MKDSHNFNDKDLIRGIISRDDRILGSLYELYFPSVSYLVIRNNGTEDDARDVFQNSILVLFQKIRDKHFSLNCSLKTYIYSVARFLWLKELEKRKKYVNHPVNEEDFIDLAGDTTEIYERNERLNLYRKVFEKLSDNCKKILTLYNEGRSIREITIIMGYNSEQHTKNRCYRCKLTLINMIKATYGYQELKYEEFEDNRGLS